MNIRATKGLTFEDVLLLPRRSAISSRQQVDTSTRLTDNIRINIPVISANMDTVTEAAMAIAMAKAGGMGIIHRFMPIDMHVKQIKNVKRAQAVMVENPYCINLDATVEQAREEMRRYHVGGLVVTNESGRVVGIVTTRDVNLAPPDRTMVSQVMTGMTRLVTASPHISLEDARKVLYEHRIEKLPIVNSDGMLVGLITAQDVLKPLQNPLAALDDKGRLRVGGAIGVSNGEIERAGALLEAGADVLVLDIAHGHADHCINMVRELRRRFPAAEIVAGNVASRAGARELIEAGANAIKVGIGPGSICTTRIVTGFGVPQLTAIMDCVQGVKDSGQNIPLIADGGIQKAGDMVKALAAGAETVMIGSMFAGTEEAPGSPVIRDGQKVKVVRGMASLAATMGRRAVERGYDESAEDQEDWVKVVPEGVEAVVPYRGHVGEVLIQLVGGLRSGLSYGGARNITELQETAEFMEITPAGIRESGSHDVKGL
ncbi:MAG: IMP dehydrogenase [Chloroflexi bacterium]|nr:IMP dehydrogenase [Chloroflexota bacterium]